MQVCEFRERQLDDRSGLRDLHLPLQDRGNRVRTRRAVAQLPHTRSGGVQRVDLSMRPVVDRRLIAQSLGVCRGRLSWIYQNRSDPVRSLLWKRASRTEAREHRETLCLAEGDERNTIPDS